MLCGACDRIAPLVWAVDKVSLRRGYLGWVWESWWKLSKWRKGISDKGIQEHSRQRNQQRFWSNKTKSIWGTVTGITRFFPDISVGKESACNAGDPGSIPGFRKICWRRDRLPTPVFLGFPCGSADKESACKAGDLSLIPGLGRSPGEGKGYPLQYSGLENSMDSIVHGS